jgi:hypothetical protein
MAACLSAGHSPIVLDPFALNWNQFNAKGSKSPVRFSCPRKKRMEPGAVPPRLQ